MGNLNPFDSAQQRAALLELQRQIRLQQGVGTVSPINPTKPFPTNFPYDLQAPAELATLKLSFWDNSRVELLGTSARDLTKRELSAALCTHFGSAPAEVVIFGISFTYTLAWDTCRVLKKTTEEHDEHGDLVESYLYKIIIPIKLFDATDEY